MVWRVIYAYPVPVTKSTRMTRESSLIWDRNCRMNRTGNRSASRFTTRTPGMDGELFFSRRRPEPCGLKGTSSTLSNLNLLLG